MRYEFVLLCLGIVGCSVALLSIGAAIFLPTRSRLPFVWFGLFALLYSGSLLIRNHWLDLAFAWNGHTPAYLQRGFSLLAPLPLLLLLRGLYQLKSRSFAWLMVAYGAVAALTLAAIFLQSQPEILPLPGTALILGLPVCLLPGRDQLTARLRLASPIVTLGALLFFAGYAYDHARGMMYGHWTSILEPFGFLAFLLCLSNETLNAYATTRTQLTQLNTEMEAAGVIQQSILSKPVEHAGIRVAVRYLPMEALGGDFYDFPVQDDEELHILLADVIGHGIGAALVTSMVKAAVRTFAGDTSAPGPILTDLNAVLCSEARGQYVTATYFAIHRSNNSFSYTSAGHPPPLYWSAQQQRVVHLDSEGLLLGVRNHEQYTDTRFNTTAGDRLLIYTDGLSEASNAAGEEFGDHQLEALLRANSTQPPERFATLLQSALQAWTSNGTHNLQRDDITFLVVAFD
ncbi:PP2C family protein-serine/threonine phosphatase [Terriglobus tenax]|uniref:PP2C family protein-serine/threonine phosphatase n=1 Tax=Terriglobus tenax TaxID=1111115 RepID=UPI0021DF474A|nr:PP2C family protein-serine/threonine phosphatase [Terriglobus tenax]